MIRSKADKWFSLYIRIRAADENGMGQCVTCGTVKHVKEMDCGHYVKRQHQATRFNEINCQLQCKRCNAFEQGRDAIFRQWLVDRYGEDKVLLLEASRHTTCKRPKYVMDELERIYKEKAKTLAQQKGIELW
jgi:hypothetical protein